MAIWLSINFPNSEILFDFNEGSSGVFKDHLMFYLVRGELPGIVSKTTVHVVNTVLGEPDLQNTS